MTRLEALAFIDSEIVTRVDYGTKLAAKKPPVTAWALEQERERLRKFKALRQKISAGLIGEMNREPV